MNLHLQAQAGYRGRIQIQALTLGPPGEAEDLGEEGDRRGTGSGGGRDDHNQFVSWCWKLNLGDQKDLIKFEEEVFWVWVFS